MSVDGLLVAAPKGPALDKTIAAVHLIQKFDPLRFQRIVRDVENVWVWLTMASTAHFRPESWSCVLDEDFVVGENTSLASIASSIVHEATHARLFRMGFAYEEAARSRIEKICVRRETAFARRLPNGNDNADLAEQKLHVLPNLDLSNKGLEERNLAGAEARLRHHGAPEWLIKALATLRAWLRRYRKKGVSDDSPAP